MTNKEKTTPSAYSKIAAALSSFHMEADRSTKGMSVILSGVIGISNFSDSSIHLLSHGGRIVVNGQKLFICVYENNSVEIVGKVEGVVFKYGKN